MKNQDVFRTIAAKFSSLFASRYEDSYNPAPRVQEGAKIGIKGEVFMTLRDTHTGVEEKRHLSNLVVKDASILIARLVRDSQEAPHGAFVLAVGTGAPGWDPMNPPAATNTQRALWGELTRKTFALTQFVNSVGVPVAYPTNIVDFTTTFAESEAVGPLVEMGILMGNVSSNMATRNPVSPPNGPYDPTVDLTQYETLGNYLTFSVINKPPTSTFTIVWRLSF
jgi:hypothetical protein